MCHKKVEEQKKTKCFKSMLGIKPNVIKRWSEIKNLFIYLKFDLQFGAIAS